MKVAQVFDGSSFVVIFIFIFEFFLAFERERDASVRADCVHNNTKISPADAHNLFYSPSLYLALAS